MKYAIRTVLGTVAAAALVATTAMSQQAGDKLAIRGLCKTEGDVVDMFEYLSLNGANNDAYDRWMTVIAPTRCVDILDLYATALPVELIGRTTVLEVQGVRFDIWMFKTVGNPDVTGFTWIVQPESEEL